VGLDVQSMRGLEYNPLSKRYKLSADTSVNYMIATQKSSD
jgi:2-polyprenyl-6-hydroxyphenyl methylase/3-demethylubiquinone-9 3-methyltransferase